MVNRKITELRKGDFVMPHREWFRLAKPATIELLQGKTRYVLHCVDATGEEFMVTRTRDEVKSIAMGVIPIAWTPLELKRKAVACEDQARSLYVKAAQLRDTAAFMTEEIAAKRS